ncbi:hypothetical protein FEM48_Zijuj09G0101900 [Ziziphus jujuba var. spinosa]|uniref:Uncharacterized protein n=1 Tax=Ziziphus jujuba var. spinosa TaxID=714518 RepID=A0A978USE2_ZIZJJ|nr:hypothetical protein FEM48_Zijuj09G0101900 [Ziziphus jujuba var. spinosa]
MDWDAYLKEANSKLDEQQRAAIIAEKVSSVGSEEDVMTCEEIYHEKDLLLPVDQTTEALIEWHAMTE